MKDFKDTKFYFSRADELSLPSDIHFKKPNGLINNFGAFDNRLAPTSRLLLLIMANSLITDQEYHFSDLMSRTGLNYSDVGQGIKELKRYGYLEIFKTYNPEGDTQQHVFYEYIFYCLPKEFSLNNFEFLIGNYINFIGIEYPAIIRRWAKEYEHRDELLFEESICIKVF